MHKSTSPYYWFLFNLTTPVFHNRNSKAENLKLLQNLLDFQKIKKKLFAQVQNLPSPKKVEPNFFLANLVLSDPKKLLERKKM